MGEAKRREMLGLTRQIVVTRSDLFYLLEILMTPGQNGKLKEPGDKTKRKAFMSAMRQVGLAKVWKFVQQSETPVTTERQLEKAFPDSEVREITVDALRVLQEQFVDTMNVRAVLNLADFEEMLDQALDGTFVVPKEEEPVDGRVEVEVAPATS